MDKYSYWQAAKEHGFYERCRAFHTIATEAAQVGREKQLSPDEFEWGIQQLFDAYSSFLSAMNPSSREWEDRQPWCNHFRDARLGKKLGEPEISQDLLSGAAYTYLKGSLRVPSLDRGLIDAFIAQETFAYIDRHAGRGAMATQVGCFVVWLVLWAILEAFFGSAHLNLWRGVGAIVAIALVIWAWPWKGPYVLYRAMRDTYQLLTGSVVSVQELRRRVENARDKGVVWPAELYAVLDDIEARTRVL